jgi:aminoglycoside phosphotransferase (APT) family kinase protein
VTGAGSTALEKALARFFRDNGGAHVVQEVRGGTYNDVLLGRLGDSQEIVVKVSPCADVPRLTYEDDLLRTEAEFYRLAGDQGAPVPRVLGYSEELLPGHDVLVLSRLPGANLSDVRGAIGQGPAERAVHVELGEVAGRLHSLTAPGFGYPFRGQRLWGRTWPEAFEAMVAAVLRDAERFSVELPVAPARVSELVQASREALAEVATPSLVHWDLWDGDLLVGTVGGVPRLTGIVDGERALYADPVMELPSLARVLDSDDGLVAGYVSTGRRLGSSPRSDLRLALYYVYLNLIMLVEATPRRYTGQERDRAQCARVITSRLELAATLA